MKYALSLLAVVATLFTIKIDSAAALSPLFKSESGEYGQSAGQASATESVNSADSIFASSAFSSASAYASAYLSVSELASASAHSSASAFASASIYQFLSEYKQKGGHDNYQYPTYGSAPCPVPFDGPEALVLIGVPALILLGRVGRRKLA